MNGDEEVSADFVLKQLSAGLNTLSKSVSAMEDRVSDLESESKSHAAMIAAGDSAPPSMPSSNTGSGESRAFAVKTEVVGEGESAETVYYITNCRFLFGRRVVVLDEDFVLPAHMEGESTVIDDGKYYLMIPHEDPDSAEIVTDPGDGNDDKTTVIPLFEYSDGSVVDDYRGMPTIPVYETKEDVEIANERL